MDGKKQTIQGINLPTVEAEPEVKEAFDKNRAESVKDIGEQVDCTPEIEGMLRRARQSPR